jgi:hypothetical protein
MANNLNENFKVYPISYLHLLMKPEPRISMQIDPFYQFDIKIDHSGSGYHPQPKQIMSAGIPTLNMVTDYVNFDSTVVTVNKGNFTPVKVGDTFGIIRSTEVPGPPGTTPVVRESAVRVKVHEKIDEFWIGNNSITIHEGESNYVVSVYARFSDGSFGDITYHPYLEFKSDDPTKLTVSPEGRLTGKKKGSTVTVKVKHDGVEKTIDVKVIDPLSTSRPILELVHGSGKYTEKRNILLLAEGFADTADDKALFTELTTKLINDELFKGGAYSPFSPYNLLTDEFIVWRAFVPSGEAGITLLNPVTPDGMGIESETGHETNLHGYVQSVDSFFGIGMGGRIGEKDSYDPALFAGKTAKQMWFRVDDALTIPEHDRKRMDNLWGRDNFTYKFIRSLKLLSPASTSDPNKDVYKTWSHETNFKDTRFICFILKDEFRSGVNMSKKIDKTTVGSLVVSMGKRVDDKHTIVVRSGTNRIIDYKPAITDFATYKPDMHVVTEALAHEFAHSVRIGDEYEDTYNEGHPVFQQSPASNLTDIENGGFVNLLDYYRIKDPANAYPAIDFDKLIWNWHLVDMGSLLQDKAVISGKKMTVKLAKGQGANYKTQEEVFVRHPLMNVNPSNLKEGITELLKIDAINPHSTFDELKLEAANTITGTFPKRSLLFRPVKNKTGVIQTLILPEVLAHLKTRKKPFDLPGSQPLPKETRTTKQNEEFGGAAEFPGLIPNIPLVYCSSYIVGAYEGGGTYNTRVYRPTGWSMMRGGHRLAAGTTINIWSEMSVVDRYILLNDINASLLSKLDTGDRPLRNL